MDRRDFLKGMLVAAALTPVLRLEGMVRNRKKTESPQASNALPQITRRPYKDSSLLLPLLGFGLMRLPRKTGGAIDYAAAKTLVARAMAQGVNYFDTAYFYHNGLSEKFVGDVLSKYPRDSYFLADKLPLRSLRRPEDVERIFKEQLVKCRTAYFDFYLLHSVNRSNWKTAQEFHVYEFLKKMQAEGKIRKLGFSFHDEPEILQKVAESAAWDFAQIQLNYLDWELYRSREQYEILTKLGIPVVIMEPLKGGALASLNPKADAILKKANPKSSLASWAFRYAASLPNVMCVLSGMTKLEQLEDNLRTFAPLRELSEPERKVLQTALAAYQKSSAVPCTACRYCMPCPVGVDIPRIFGLYNQAKISGDFRRFSMSYSRMDEDSRASACVNCGACKKKCPQKINIPEMLREVEADWKQKVRRKRS